MTAFVIRVAALALAVCGILLLQAAWRAKGASSRSVLAGWGLLAASILTWSFTSGAEKGVAMGIIAAVLVVLAFLAATFLRAEQRPLRSARQRETETGRLGWTIIVRRIWAGVLIGPAAGLAALALSTGAFVGLGAMGVEHTVNLTIVSFALPILWAGLGVIGGWGQSLLRKTATIVLAGVIPWAYLTAVA